FGVRLALDEPGLAQAFDHARHACGVHLQPRHYAGERHAATAGKGEEPQEFKTRERQTKRLESSLDPREQQLLRPHHRGHESHAVRRVLPAVVGPLTLGLSDRVDLKGSAFRHPCTSFDSCSTLTTLSVTCLTDRVDDAREVGAATAAS